MNKKTKVFVIKTDRIWEIITLIIMFLFSISLFNLAGYIFSVLILVMIITNISIIRISITELLLMAFSVLYFIFFSYHYEFEFENIILYLFGPWMAFITGRMYIKNAKNRNSFLILIIVLALGMCIHGWLNLVAYMQSSHFASYQSYRRSVDFWRGDLVNVNTTGMYYTFASGISIGIVFSNLSKKIKFIAWLVLLGCVSASTFFANRTLLIICTVLLLWNGIIWLRSKEISHRKKIFLVTVFVLMIVLLILGYTTNWGNMRDALVSLKIFQRFTDKNEGSRISVWAHFFKDLNFIRYPIGGGDLIQESNFSYLHNLWLDIYNTVGIFPFVIFIGCTINLLNRFFEFKNIMKKNNKSNEYIIFKNLLVAIILNCAVEPIIEANPYYFLIIMIYLGGMVEKTKMVKC